MRAYRSIWGVSVTVLTSVVLAVGAVQFGWGAMVGVVASLACLGLLFGLGWIDSPERRRVMTGSAAGFALLGVLVLVLPTVIGPWSLLVVVLVGSSYPPVVTAAARAARARRPSATSDGGDPPGGDALEARWRRTTAALREPGLPAAARLRLVQERASILDGLEARDPDGFATWFGLHEQGRDR